MNHITIFETDNLEEFKKIELYHSGSWILDLEIICEFNAMKIAKYLISKYNIDINENDGSSLQNACKYGQLNMVKYLVEECNANVNIDDEWALIWAAEKGHEHVVQYLIDKGANIYHAIDILKLKEYQHRYKAYTYLNSL